MQDVLIQNSLRNKFINFSNAKVRNAWIKSQGGGGYSRFQMTGMIKWGAKSPGLPTKPKKSLHQKLTPKNPMLFFPALKFSRKH